MANLPLIDELEAVLSTGSGARRVEMLTRLTDLFVGAADRYSDEQVGVFDDVMARLVRTIEAEARIVLSQRLAPIDNAPPAVIHLLAFDDDIAVAEPVLQHSERLDDPALVANANSKSQRHLFAISQRRRLSEAVTDILVLRGDRHVVHSVAKNAGTRFSDNAFQTLVATAASDEDLATSIGQRGDIPRRHILVLLEKASATLRTRLTRREPGRRRGDQGRGRRTGGRGCATAPAKRRRISRPRRLPSSTFNGCAASARPKC